MSKGGRGRGGVARSVAALGIFVLVWATGSCASDDEGGAASDATSSDDASVLLTAPPGTDPSTIEVAAEVVGARLDRMGVEDASVTAVDDGVMVRSTADAYQLHAAAQQRRTTIAPITSTTLGPCPESDASGHGSIGSLTRCSTLGPALTGVEAVTAPEARVASGAGWTTTFSVEGNQYEAFSTALEPGRGMPLALVADAEVALTFVGGLPALQSAIGPPLAEDSARLAAATLAVTDDLPVALQAPPLPDPPLARVDRDVWTAPLGVHVCGTWLDDMPGSGLETGVHSHGDGLVYIHPQNADEAGDRATLGLFLERGGWSATSDELELWDGRHVSGQTCPDDRPAQVRWWVDGVEQQGDPARYTPRNGQVIVIGFDADPEFPGPPPQMASFFPPRLGADKDA